MARKSTDPKDLIPEARSPGTSFERLMKLQKHPEIKVRRALLDNPNLVLTQEDGKLNLRLLEKLAREFPEEVAVHPTFVLHALIEPDEAMGEVVVEVVGRTTDVGLIDHVFRTWGPDSWGVRKSVAQNPNTPPEVLRLLGNEETEDDADVRQGVASNPHTPEDTLRLLGNPKTESKEWVRYAVASNPTTPPDVLRSLGNETTESKGWVRKVVAQNPRTPSDVLRTLGNPSTESDEWIREVAKEALAARGLA